jgi:translocation protein SEC63
MLTRHCQGTSEAGIRRQYRELSRKYHPDKNVGDTSANERYVRIVRAYETLTDPVSRENWERYGNPDGPRRTLMGIALPAWLFKDNQGKVAVLMVYIFIFLILLPGGVGYWWYTSRNYADNRPLLLITEQRLRQQLSDNIAVKRMAEILSEAEEYRTVPPRRQAEGAEFDELVRQLVEPADAKRLPPAHLKALALILAHLNRVKLKSPTLVKDQEAVLLQAEVILPHMVELCIERIAGAAARKKESFAKTNVITSMQQVIKFAQCMHQALWVSSNMDGLLQVPGVQADTLSHYRTKKRYIDSVTSLGKMTDEKRRALMRSLTDDEYANVQRFLGGFPHINVKMQAYCKSGTGERLPVTAGMAFTLEVVFERVGVLEVRLRVCMRQRVNVIMGNVVSCTAWTDDQEFGRG